MLLAEVETDKATMEWEAQEEGYVAKILKPDGAKDVAVGEPVYVLVEEQSMVPAFKDFQVEGAPSAAAPAATEEPSAPPTPPPTPPPKAPKPAAPKAKKYPDHQVLGMPALSPTMSQGNIIEWMKKPGDRVEAGEVFCEVETDKATVAWESTEEGYLAQILLPAGSKDIPINTPAMVVVEDQSAVEAFKDFTAEDAVAEAEGGAPAAAAAEEAPAAEPTTTPEPPAAPTPPARTGERVVASPYARKLAAEAGLSLEGLAGSGPEGRIVAEDVHKAVAAGKAGAKPAAPAAAAPTKAAPAPPPPAPGATFTDIPHTNIRRVTARRLLEAKNTVPHYYLSMEVTVDEMLRVREQLNAANKDTGAKISVNDFVIKAAALALKKVPGVNASWHPEFIREYNNVDISVAVQTPNGLLTPIVKDADTKRMLSISNDIKALAKKAKDGKLQPHEFIGGTFSVSNLGMYGIKQFAAIINPPQAAILAVGGSEKKLVLGPDGSLKESTFMTVTLSCDHRVVDGAMGADWLRALKQHIEMPYIML